MRREYAAIIMTALLALLCATSVSCGKREDVSELEAIAPEVDTRGIVTVQMVSAAVEEKPAETAAEGATEEKEEQTVTTIEAVQASAPTRETWTDADAIALAQMAWGEARGCSKTEQAATMWCVLNRVDAWGGTVLTQTSVSGQFYGYSAFNPVTDELYALAVDVLQRWEQENAGASDVGRVLPSGYLWFTGADGHNWFRDAYSGGNVWSWEWGSPYGE